MKKIATAVLTGLLLTGTLAPAADAAPDNKIYETKGHGPGICPDKAFCLYENKNYNGSTDAAVWVYRQKRLPSGTKINLTDKNGIDFGRSAIAKDKDHSFIRLAPNACANVDNRDKDWEYILFFPGTTAPGRSDRYPNLNGVTGDQHYAGDNDTGGRQYIHRTSLNLNKRAGCILFEGSAPASPS